MASQPIPHVVAGELLTVALMNRLIDRINDQLGWIRCDHCTRTHRDGTCPGCGAPRPTEPPATVVHVNGGVAGEVTPFTLEQLRAVTDDDG